MAAAIAVLAPAAAVADWTSGERDVPVATGHELAVSASVAEVVYKTAPFEIVVIVDNLTDRPVEITAYHGDDTSYPATKAWILNGANVDILPVLPDGAVQGGFTGKRLKHAYKVPPRGSLSFGAEVDWRNYPDRIDPGRYRLLVLFACRLGDDKAELQFVVELPIEIRDAET